MLKKKVKRVDGVLFNRLNSIIISIIIDYCKQLIQKLCMACVSNEQSELRVCQDCLVTYEPLSDHYPNPGSAADLAIRGAKGTLLMASDSYIISSGKCNLLKNCAKYVLHWTSDYLP